MSEIVSSSDFQSKVLDAQGPVLVDFFATWCGPCKMLAPTLDEVAAEVAGRAQVYKLDIDQSPDIAQRYGVMSVPTLIAFEGGQVKKQADRRPAQAGPARHAGLAPASHPRALRPGGASRPSGRSRFGGVGGARLDPGAASCQERGVGGAPLPSPPQIRGRTPRSMRAAPPSSTCPSFDSRENIPLYACRAAIASSPLLRSHPHPHVEGMWALYERPVRVIWENGRDLLLC